MSSEKQGFPDDRDRDLQRAAERTSQLADDLVEWAGEFANSRRGGDFAVGPDEEFALYRLRRLASNYYRSANVPVAAAVYGASQVGKSLFMGRVLEPVDVRDSPLGKCDQLGPPSYIRELSFEHDINPQCGSFEATALVTRFTTKERFDETALPEYPVKVRALARSEWLRVLARGFRSECRQPKDVTWREGQLRGLFEETCRGHASDAVDRDWRIDLLDAYAYLRNIDPRQYEATESMFNSFLSQYPLTDKGYVEIAGRLFWDARNFPALSTLFVQVCEFLRKITAGGRDGILLHWAAVRFLLDSQRKTVHENPLSKWQTEVAWSDLREGQRDGWFVIDYAPGSGGSSGGPTMDQAVIQSAMLELILPVIPHRLKPDWRDVILKMDVLDLPGMRSGNSDSSGGANSIATIPEMMNVVKRGKVFYLIDRYIEERQVQTLLLLVRGGNLDVRQLLKEYIDKWGRARYGEAHWPAKVVATQPALFIGLTGIDAEFDEKRPPDRALYDNRLNQLVNETLYDVMTDFGGPRQPFTNVFPIRYPGSWDKDEAGRASCPERWTQAGRIFVESEMVRKYVRNPEEKWRFAMRDDDGGLSLICRGFMDCTTAIQKQDALGEQIRKTREDLHQLAAGWHCDPNANADRERRLAVARQVLLWLEDEQRVYDRVHALQTALCFDEGDAMEIAEFAESRAARNRARPEPIEQRFPLFLRELLGHWARERAVSRWRDHTASGDGGAPWLSVEDFGLFARYLAEYLCSPPVFAQLNERLLSIIALPVRDAGDRRQATREYVRVVVNDYVLNPGADDAPSDASAASEARDFGLMTPFIRRWRGRLPAALASAAGEHTLIPPGNDELRQLLNRF